MARIFISYRRQDSAYPAGILRDALQAGFGTDSVFFDLDNIPFGVDFRQYIGNAVGQCDVLLVMIGDQWLQLTDDQGRRRIENLSDYVRIEIESALKRDIPVVPVLIDEAKMPGAGELPESIRDMAFRNAAEIRAGRDQKHQIERLVSGLAEHWSAKVVSDAKEEKSAAAVQEESSAPKPRAQPKVRESAQPKPQAVVSGAGEEKSAAPKEEKPAEPQPRETMTRPKVRKSAKPKPQAAESAAAKSTPAISESDLDQRAAFLDQARKVFEGVPHQALWLAGEVPPKKAHAATKTYAPKVSPDAIMVLYDDTVFGGAKEGLLLTVDAIYWHNRGEKPRRCRYADIQNVSTTRNRLEKLSINNELITMSYDPTDQIAQGVAKLIRTLKPELQRRLP